MATEPADSAGKEAFQFWGYLFKQDNCGVDLLDRLLAGIANYIVCALRRQPVLDKCPQRQRLTKYLLRLHTTSPASAQISLHHSLRPSIVLLAVIMTSYSSKRRLAP